MEVPRRTLSNLLDDTCKTVATYLSLVLPATRIMKFKFTKHVIISVWICSQKNLLNMLVNVNSHAHRQHLKYIIQHMLVYIYWIFFQKPRVCVKEIQLFPLSKPCCGSTVQGGKHISKERVPRCA